MRGARPAQMGRVSVEGAGISWGSLPWTPSVARVPCRAPLLSMGGGPRGQDVESSNGGWDPLWEEVFRPRLLRTSSRVGTMPGRGIEGGLCRKPSVGGGGRVEHGPQLPTWGLPWAQSTREEATCPRCRWEISSGPSLAPSAGLRLPRDPCPSLSSPPSLCLPLPLHLSLSLSVSLQPFSPPPCSTSAQNFVHIFSPPALKEAVTDHPHLKSWAASSSVVWM